MYEREMKIAIQAVKKAEPTFRKYFGTKTKVQTKEGNYRNVVSYADKKIEIDTKKFLLKKFPQYGFIGEEYGSFNPKAKFVWVLDAIDGTSNYLYGIADCPISLGLLEDNKPVVGVVFAPLLNKLYTGVRGKGAWLNGKKIHISKTGDLKMAFGCLGWARDLNWATEIFPKIIHKIFKLRVLGSGALGLCNVARGSYDFYLTVHLEVWDYAAAQVILEEAGGVLLQSKKPRMQIAANKSLATKLLRMLSSS